MLMPLAASAHYYYVDYAVAAVDISPMGAAVAKYHTSR